MKTWGYRVIASQTFFKFDPDVCAITQDDRTDGLPAPYLVDLNDSDLAMISVVHPKPDIHGYPPVHADDQSGCPAISDDALWIPGGIPVGKR